MKTKKEIPKWIEKLRHANKGKPGVRVYYLMDGVDIVCSDIAVSVTKGRVQFDDGWCHAKDCYLTAGQCRRATGLWFKDKLAAARDTVTRASETLKEADARLTALANSLVE